MKSSRKSGCLIVVGIVSVAVPIVVTDSLGLGPAHDQVAAHEGLIVEHFDATNRVIHVEHLHEAVTFRAVGCAVVNDFDAADRADAFEQFLNVLFGDIVGQIADIHAGGLDRRWITTARALGIAPTLAFAGSG